MLVRMAKLYTRLLRVRASHRRPQRSRQTMHPIVQCTKTVIISVIISTRLIWIGIDASVLMSYVQSKSACSTSDLLIQLIRMHHMYPVVAGHQNWNRPESCSIPS